MTPHPAAASARAAMAANRYEVASQILEDLSVTDAAHADVITEKAWILALRGREDTAFTMLGAAKGGVRYELLRKLLAEHYKCRFSLDATDTFARNACADLRDVAVGPVGTKLSACIIAKNEARNLPRCLTSLLDICDEIVVVDTGSTDRTVAIAIEFGAVVGSFPWTNDFAAARNAALDLATGNWILWIDADEELTRDSYAAIHRARCRPQFGGFDLEIVNLVDEREFGAHILHYPTRLFRKVPGVRFTGAIHEQIQPSLAALGLPWARLEGARLIHHGYRPSALASGEKLARTRTMLEAEVARNPHDGFQWFNLANANLTEGRFSEAIQTAEVALRTIGPGQPWRDLSWQVLSSAYLRKGEYEAALQICDRCDAAGDGGLLNDYERTQALCYLGRFGEALVVSDRSMLYEWKRGQTGDVGVATHKRFFIRGQILFSLGRLDDAHAMFNRALEGDSGFAPARLARAQLLEKAGRPVDAIRDYERVLTDPEVRPHALKGLGRSRMAAHLEGAAEAFSAAFYANTSDNEAWQLWCKACRNDGDWQGLLAAFQVLADHRELTGEGLVDWGRALHAVGDLSGALDCFTQAIEVQPLLANAYFNAGDLLYSVGAYPEASRVYESGLRLQPQHVEGWFALGNALAQLDLNEAARVAYDQVLSLRPGHPGAMHNRQQLAA